ncbi:MAG: hypothetical protein ACRDQZ_19460 [Mycobacteriales bacterium]
MAKKAAVKAQFGRLQDFKPTDENDNRHTERGTGLMEASLRECGFGDSMTADKHGVIISGNQRLETVGSLGFQDPIIVESDGTRPIIHKRTDLDAKSPQAKKLALLANRVAELNLDWDPEMLALHNAEFDLAASGIFSVEELNKILGNVDGPDAFAEVGDDLQTEYRCPKCGYEWSGQSQPGNVRLAAAIKEKVKQNHKKGHEIRAAKNGKNGKKGKKLAAAAR